MAFLRTRLHLFLYFLVTTLGPGSAIYPWRNLTYLMQPRVLFKITSHPSS